MKKLLQICTTVLFFIAPAKAQPKWIAVDKEKSFVQENGFGVYIAKNVTLTKDDYIVKNHYQKIYGLPVKTGDHVHVQINNALSSDTRLMVIAEIPGKREFKVFKDTLTGEHSTPYVFDTAFASSGQFYLYVSTVRPTQEAVYYIRIIYSPKENNELKDSSFCGRLQMLVRQSPYEYIGFIEGVKAEDRTRKDKSNKSYLLSPDWNLPGLIIYKNAFAEFYGFTTDDFYEIRVYESLYAETTNSKIAYAKRDEMIKKIEGCLPSWKRVKDAGYDFESIDKKEKITISVQEVKTGNNSKYMVLFSCTY